MILVAAPIEHDLGHAFGLGPLGEARANRRRRLAIRALLEGLAERLLEARGRRYRMPLLVVNHLMQLGAQDDGFGDIFHWLA